MNSGAGTEKRPARDSKPRRHAVNKKRVIIGQQAVLESPCRLLRHGILDIRALSLSQGEGALECLLEPCVPRHLFSLAPSRQLAEWQTDRCPGPQSTA